MKLSKKNNTQGFSDKELYQFLPAVLEVTETPPNKVAIWITWSIIGLFLCAIAWAFIGKVDVVVVGTGQLVSIQPQPSINGKADIPFKAQVQFENGDVGFLKKGLPVAIKVNAFKFTRYGMLNGELGTLRPGSMSSVSQQMAFMADVTVLSNDLNLGVDANGLMAGMAITAEVKIAERRIIDFILSPINTAISESAREQ